MAKFQAMLGVVVTIILAAVGFSGYAEGSHVMTWFGIELNQTGFFVLIAVFCVIDFFALRRAFGQGAAGTPDAAPRLPDMTDVPRLTQPCQVVIERQWTPIGAAMGVQVYLNGVDQGVLKNGKQLALTTEYAENTLRVHYSADGTEKELAFSALAGGPVRVRLKYVGAVLTLVEGAADKALASD